MAWIVWRGRGAVKWAHVRWKDPRTHREMTRPLRTTAPDIAEMERVRVERDLEQRVTVDRRPPADALKGWLAEKEAAGRSAGTVQHNQAKAGRLVRAWEGRTFPAWTATDIAAWVRETAGTVPRTVQAYLVSITALLTWARRHGYPVPASLVEEVREIERPRMRVEDRGVLTTAQVRAMLAAVRGAPLEVPVALAARAGLALGDIRTLRWDELDLTAGTLARRAGRAKTGERYEVALDPALVAILAGAPKRGPLVCGQQSSRDWQRAIVAVYDRAGVARSRGDGWHRLRHAYGTAMLRAGADLATVRAAMGHAPGSTATLRYLHPDLGAMRRAVKRVGKALD